MNLFHAIERKIISNIYKKIGYDKITHAKINKREDLIEIGTKYGGWVVPSGLLSSTSICYCAGCGEDISFDLGLIRQFDCNVYAFDPTPKSIKYVNQVTNGISKYHFYDIGLWDKDDTLKFYAPKNADHVSHSLVNLQKTDEYIYVRVRRLLDIMSDLGHAKIDMIKIDIEGAEYKVIETILEDGIDVSIICVEYDECYNPLDSEYKRRIRDSVRALLSKNYKLVCVQGYGNYTFIKA